jgi:Cytochrome c7 and related cytochrome c/Cytochrome c3
VKRSKGSFALIVAAQVLGALLFVAPRVPAQQATPAQAVKQEVPDNPLAPKPPVQPIPYSHKTHLALGLKCQDCHTNPEPGNLMTFPVTSKCMQCHATIAKDKPAIQKLAEYDTSGKPVPWVRVYRLLPGVEWSHRKHVDAGVMCEACHGQVAEMDAMSEVTSVTSMVGCLNCHASTEARTHNAKTTCVTCHTFADPSLRGSTR